MLGFEDDAVISNFVAAQDDNPMPRKVYPTHTVYLSHNNFGSLLQTSDENPIFRLTPKIIDFGLAQRTDTLNGAPLIHPIQVNQLHAPEVLLGLGW